jgi:nitrogen PTS system EIIA component
MTIPASTRRRNEPDGNGTAAGRPALISQGLRMSLISQILLPENILLDTESTSKKRVFERVGILFENSQQIARSQVFDSLFARERLGSTGLGQGVAIPHGRIKGLRNAAAAFVKTQTPIPFDAPDGQPVNLIFVLLVPERATDQHLQLLGELAQMFSDKAFREQLQACSDPAAIHQLFADWKA